MALFEADPEGIVVAFDDEWRRSVGVDVGRPWTECVAAEQRADVEDRWVQARRRRLVFEVTVSCTLVPGIRAVTVRAEPASRATGLGPHYLGSLQVHEPGRIDEASVLASVADAILAVRADGRIVLANAQAHELFRYGPGELCELTVEDLLPRALRDTHRAHREAFARAPRVRPMGDRVLVAKRRDGTLVPVEIRLAPLDGGDGPMVSVVVRDVRDRAEREAEAMLRGRVAQTEVLASTLVHEINNPLTTIVANLELATLALRGSGDASPATLECVTDALSGAIQIRDLVRELHMLASPSHGSVASVDLSVVIDRAIRLAGPRVSTSIPVARRYEEVPRVRASDVLLYQVFLNLFVNAAEAMADIPPEHRRIEVRLCSEGDRVICDVSDSGPGVPPELVDRVFEPYFSTKGRQRQSGIGLALCRHILHGYQGRLSVVDRPGAGATFRVELPATG